MIDQFLSKLEKVKRRGGGKYMASCPCHKDRSPSLSIKDDNGTILMRCFSQECTPHDICAAIGFDMRDLFPPSDYSNFSPDDYKPESKKRSYFSADQMLAALQDETLVAFLIADEMTKTTIDAATKARLVLAVSRIQAAKNYMRN